MMLSKSQSAHESPVRYSKSAASGQFSTLIKAKRQHQSNTMLPTLQIKSYDNLKTDPPINEQSNDITFAENQSFDRKRHSYSHLTKFATRVTYASNELIPIQRKKHRSISVVQHQFGQQYNRYDFKCTEPRVEQEVQLKRREVRSRYMEAGEVPVWLKMAGINHTVQVPLKSVSSQQSIHETTKKKQKLLIIDKLDREIKESKIMVEARRNLHTEQAPLELLRDQKLKRYYEIGPSQSIIHRVCRTTPDKPPQKYSKIRRLSKKVDIVQSPSKTTYARHQHIIGWSNRNDGEVEKMRGEFGRLQGLQHPFILPIVEQYTNDKEREMSCFGRLSHYVVYQCAEGPTLEREIRERARTQRFFSNSEILYQFTMLTLALHHTHSHSLSHHNLSSAHIYLTHHAGSQIIQLTAHQNVLVKKYWEAKYKCNFIGEWWYLSPEVIKGEEYGEKSDMWALGVLLLEMVTLANKPTYDRNNLQKQKPFTEQQVKAQAHHQISPHYSSTIHEILHLLLQVDRQKRVSSQELLNFPAIQQKVFQLQSNSIFNDELKLAFGRAGHSNIEAGINDYFHSLNPKQINQRVAQYKVDLQWSAITAVEEQTLLVEAIAVQPLFEEYLVEDLKPFKNDPEHNEMDFKKFIITIRNNINQFKNQEELEQEKQKQIDDTINELARRIAMNFKQKSSANTTLLRIELARLLFFERTEKEKSEDILRETLFNEPKNLKCLELLARIQFNKTNYYECQATLEKIDKLHKSNSVTSTEMLFLKARVLQNIGEEEESLKTFMRCLGGDKDHYGASVNIGNILTKKNQFQTAAKYFQNGLRITQDGVSAYFGLCICIVHSEIGSSSAIRLLRTQIRTEPNNIEKLMILAILRFFSNDDKRALGLVNRCLEIHNSHLPALFLLGEILRFTGSQESAKTYYAETLKVNALQPSAFKGLAKAHFDCGDYEKAFEFFEEDRRLMSDNRCLSSDLLEIDNDWRLNLGLILKKKGKYNEAMILFADALRVDPNFLPASKNMSLLSLDTAIKKHRVNGQYFPETAIVSFLMHMAEKLDHLRHKQRFRGLIDTRNLFMHNEWKVSFYKKLGRNQFHNFIGEKKSTECDIFDLGVVLFSMCNRDYLDVDRYLDTEEPVKIPACYHKKLETLLREMLAPNKGDRPTSTELLHNEYCKCLLATGEYEESVKSEEEEDICGHCGTWEEYKSKYKSIQKKSSTTGMGVIYVVERYDDKKYFVMKKHSIENPFRFETEDVRKLKKMEHCNIATFVQSFHSKEENEFELLAVETLNDIDWKGAMRTHLTISEHCSHGDLTRQILMREQNDQQMPTDFILSVLVQCLNGLQYAHKCNVLHLGLKPDNVLLCGTGEVKLSDFRVKNCPVECMCKEGTFFYYKAPEAFAKETEKTVDGRADIWALGCIIHEMITFRRTFEIDAITLSHQDEEMIMKNILEAVPARLSSFYSRQLRNLVHRILQKDPKERPTIDQILDMPFLKKTIQTIETNKNIQGLVKPKGQALEHRSTDIRLKKTAKNHGLLPMDKRAVSVNKAKPKTFKMQRSQTKIPLFQEEQESIQERNLVLLEKEQWSRSASLHFFKAEDPISLNGEEVIKESFAAKPKDFRGAQPPKYEIELYEIMNKVDSYSPSGDLLQKLAPDLLNSHRLTHIMYEHDLYGKMTHVSFKFNHFISPMPGTYAKGATKIMDIPAYPEPLNIKFHIQDYEDKLNLYSIELQAEEGLEVIVIEPKCWSKKYHVWTEELDWRAGERIVAAKVTVDQRRKETPESVAFLLYDFI